MAKTCKCEGCKYTVFGKGYCKYHQNLRTDKKPKKAKQAKPIAKVSAKKLKAHDGDIWKAIAIAPASKKRAGEIRQYSINRKIFLAKPENRMCRVYPWLEAKEIHHMAGKENDMLLDENWWLPVSMKAHREIEASPEWAFANGWSVTRVGIKPEINNGKVEENYS